MTTFYATEDLNSIPGLVVKTDGKNNKVLIEEGATFELSQIFISGDDNVITLGSCNLYHKLSINLKGEGKNIFIGKSDKNIRCLKVISIRGDGQQLRIGDNFSCGGFELQMNDGNEACYIGDNCLFSWDIKARTSDGHSIVDITTGRATNIPRDIWIGSRVWVGEAVYFNKGSKISNDSTVASRAVVTKPFNRENVIIAGFPAKIVKDNVRWDRRKPADYNRDTDSVLDLGESAFLHEIENKNYNLAFKNWLHDIKSVNSKTICANLHYIENDKIFKAVLIELSREKFNFITPTSLCDYVYVLYRTNRTKHEFYRRELESINELDYYTKACFGLLEKLDIKFVEQLLETNNKKLILRAMSFLPIHEKNIKSVIEYKALNKLSNPILKLAYNDILTKPYSRSSELSIKTNEKLKIAVCISGQLRGYKQALSTWSAFGFNAHDVDSYVCVWEQIGRKKLHPSHLDRVITPNVSQVFKDFISSFGFPKFEKQFPTLISHLNRTELINDLDLQSAYNTKNVIIVNDEDHMQLSNIEKMYMMINKCWDMIPEPGKYDLIIRIRPDRELTKFSFDLRKFKFDDFSNVIIADTPANIHTDNIYMGDQFAMGTPKVMKVYSELYSNYLQKCSSLFEVEGFKNLEPHASCYANLLTSNIMVYDAKEDISFGSYFDGESICINTLESLILNDISKESDLYVKLKEAIFLDQE